MTGFYVVGARQNRGVLRNREFNVYDSGCICYVDFASGRSELLVEYISPPEVHADKDFNIMFKAGTVQDNRLYTCTETEVMIYELPGLSLVNRITLPSFNDLHHVRPCPDGSLLLAVTGLDLVLNISLNGKVLGEWGALDEDTWQRFSRDVDYRKIHSTKPHKSHPNYVFYLGDEIWVTRFQQRDAVCVADRSKTIDIAVQRPHDGVVVGGRVYFTTVDGHVVIANATTHQVERVINLNEITGARIPLGWCRGIEILDEDQVLVGFTRLRATKLKENVKWVQQKLGLETNRLPLPTRVSLYRLSDQKHCRDFNLEDLGMNAVFSIHAVADRPETPRG